MDCEVHWIGCQLSEIAEKIGQPTFWDIAGVVVAALAAAGTLWIGVMNIILLRRQGRIEAAQREQNEREQRFVFAQQLLDEFSKRAVLEPGLYSAEIEERNEASVELFGTAMRQNFLSGPDLTSWVLGQGEALNREHPRVLEVTEIVGHVAMAWADDPTTYEKVAPKL